MNSKFARSTIATIIFATHAAFALADDDAYTITDAKGIVWHVMPGTLRHYNNTGGTEQWDMLVEKTMPDGAYVRARIGVTGCPSGQGQTGLLDTHNQPSGTPNEWVYNGDRVFDGLALRICIEAHNHGQFRWPNESNSNSNAAPAGAGA